MKTCLNGSIIFAFSIVTIQAFAQWADAHSGHSTHLNDVTSTVAKTLNAYG
jgi:hypothetical protein